MSTPLVSIIVPVYKVEPYLKRCLDSIVNQAYTNLEIILVDDGSPDSCPQICDEYAAKDKRIIVIHKENGGLSDARNNGLNICTGDYIFFIDSDDYITSDCIQTLVAIAKEKDFEIVVGNFQKVFSFKEVPNNHKKIKYNSFSPSQAIERLGGGLGLTFTIACGKLYKRCLWTEIRFPKGKLYEDAYVSHLLYAKSRTIAFIDIPLYFYLQRTDSIMGQTTDPLHALEPKLIFNSFLKGNYPELQYISLSKLCWNYLFAYSLDTTKKEFLDKFYHYYKEYKIKPKPLSVQRLFLCIFASMPSLYVLYQHKSPFRLRKK